MAAHLDRVGTQTDWLDRRLRGPRQLDDRATTSEGKIREQRKSLENVSLGLDIILTA